MNPPLLAVHCTLQPDGAFTADGNVALSMDGVPVFSVSEERVSRRKYDGDFRAALAYCLERNKIAAADLAAVAVSTFAREADAPDEAVADIAGVVRKALGREDIAIEIARSHHEIHAYAAAACCPEPDVLIGVIDNEGSRLAGLRDAQDWSGAFERTSYYRRTGNDLELVARDHDGVGEIGYGKAYSKATRYIGFPSYQDSGKTMGLAPFGSDAYCKSRLFASGEGARTEMLNSEDGIGDLMAWFARRGVDLPAPRSSDAPIRWSDANVAYWIQDALERSVCERLSGLVRQHGPKAVALAGGVALNCVMNSKLRACLPVRDVFVPPAPGDTGLAMGALAWLERKRSGKIPLFPSTPFLGGVFSEDEAMLAVSSEGVRLRGERVADAAADCAGRLAAGSIVGWFQGASEFGPRSLGHRSILADPRNPWIKEVLNNQVKSREWFRPYAPAVLEEHAAEYFEGRFESPYMMHIAWCRAAAREKAPSAAHVDNTARLQTVVKDWNPMLHAVIDAFRKLTGVAILLNTSFNLGGEPIVETPADAVSTFLRAPRMDVLYLGNLRVERAP